MLGTQEISQSLPVVRGKSDLKPADRFVRQTATLQVVAGRHSAVERFLKPLCGETVHLEELVPLTSLRGVRWPAIQTEASTARQEFRCFDKPQVLVFLNELENISG